MKRIALLLAVLLSSSALAQVQVEIGLPSVRFEAPPPLIEVEPGIQVVPDHDEEIFVVGGVYYTRRGERWYRAGDHRGGWVEVERGRVPGRLVGYAPGRFRHWRREEHRAEERRDVRQEVRREERHEERKEERHEEKREEKHHH